MCCFSCLPGWIPHVVRIVYFSIFPRGGSNEVRFPLHKLARQLSQRFMIHSIPRAALVARIFMTSSVTDPGFPRRGRQLLNLGQKSIIWQDFCRKLHENERNWTKRGHTSLLPSPWIRQCFNMKRITTCELQIISNQ